MRRFLLYGLALLLCGCAGTRQPSKEQPRKAENRLKELQEIVSKNPGDFRSYYQLGQITANNGDTLLALNYLDSALVIQKSYSEARLFKGELLYKKGQTKKAFEEWTALMEQDTATSWAKRVGAMVGRLYSVRQITDSPADQANPCYDPTGDWIVYQSKQNNNWDLFLMNRSGGDVTQLTRSPLNDESPVFADAKTIYFNRQQSADKELRDIFAFDLVTKTEKAMIVHPADDWYPAPTPDGKWLFFVSDRASDGNSHSKIYKLDLVSHQIFPVLANDSDYSSPWVSPVQEELLFTVKMIEHYALFKSRLNGKDSEKLSKREIDFGAPKFSPNGERVVFFSKIANNIDLFELNLQTDELVRLTTDPKNDLSPSYAPDGKHIIFYSNRGGHYQIYEMNLQQPITRAQMLDWLRTAQR